MGREAGKGGRGGGGANKRVTPFGKSLLRIVFFFIAPIPQPPRCRNFRIAVRNASRIGVLDVSYTVDTS